MKDIIRMTVLMLIVAFPALAGADAAIPYEKISIERVFSKRITRDQTDRVYSGQIKSQTGLTEFEKTYGITLARQDIDFAKQMLIFGMTDSITTQAFQFLKQQKINTFTLDYAETGIQYRLRTPEKGKKWSYLEVFILDRIDGIPHVRVKNSVENGLSRVYHK